MSAGAFPDRKPWISLLLATLGAVPWAFAFGIEGRLVLPWVALVPLLLLAERRHAALWSWLHGVVFWLVAIPWIAPTLATFGDLGMPLGALLLLVLALYLGLFHAAFGWLASLAWRRRGIVGLLLGLPAIWVVLEAARTTLLSGFPWNLAAYAWIEVPGALEASAWIGAYGVGYLGVMANTGVAVSLSRHRLRPAALGLAPPLLVLLAAATATPRAGAAAPLQVRLVQPNTPILDFDDKEEIERHYRRLLAMTPATCRRGELVVWPESAAFPFSLQHSARLNDDVERIAAGGCRLLVNSPYRRGDEVFNSAYLIGPEGGRPRYDKRHLVPYGEYVPLAETFSFIGTLARNAGNFSAADDLGLLDWQDERLGVSICYEVIFPDEVAAAVRAGATVLVSMTNDAWYGDTWAPWQHLRAARFRAAETRRPMVRAALTGVSAVVAADGSVRDLLGVGEEGVIPASVRPGTGLTPFVRVPWAVRGACLAIAAFAIFAPPAARRNAGAAPAA